MLKLNRYFYKTTPGPKSLEILGKAEQKDLRIRRMGSPLWNQLRFLPKNQGINNGYSIYKIEFYSIFKRSGTVLFTTGDYHVQRRK